MQKHTIYIIRNRINEKVYIGQTMYSTEERFKQHLKPSTLKKRGTYKLYNAMNKHGALNFFVETLETDISPNDIDAKEIYYIAKYDSFKSGYNSTVGGDLKTISSMQDVDKFKEMFFNGSSYENIAKEFDVCVATIVRTAKNLGLKKKNLITKEVLIKNSHRTNLAIAKEFRVHPETVSRAFKKYDIPRGRGCSNTLNKQNQPTVTKEKLEAMNGMKNQDIAEILGVSVSQVSKCWKKYGLIRRRCIDYPVGE